MLLSWDDAFLVRNRSVFRHLYNRGCTWATFVKPDDFDMDASSDRERGRLCVSGARSRVMGQISPGQ
eukprot:6194841-Pleurochrysis_carterae.AAC.1